MSITAAWSSFSLIAMLDTDFTNVSSPRSVGFLVDDLECSTFAFDDTVPAVDTNDFLLALLATEEAMVVGLAAGCEGRPVGHFLNTHKKEWDRREVRCVVPLTLDTPSPE